MLLNNKVVEEVLLSPEALKAIRPGSLVIDMSSIPPAAAKEHFLQLKKLGIRHLDSPVSGGTSGADQGTLAIMVGGDAEDFEKSTPVLSTMGRPTYVGPAGSGQIAKCTNQAIVTIAIAAEGLSIVGRWATGRC